uniref:Ubiquitin-like domain-containing protein n=1 Tax=Clytia hemisphaerica TaxID=252671 RepID=A0A7M5V4G1_9CNID
MSSIVKVSIYHCFQTDQAPFFESTDFRLSDRISFVCVTLSCTSTFLSIPTDLILLFNGKDFTTPLLGSTLLSTLATGDDDSISEQTEIKLYVGLRRCRQSLEIVQERKQVDSTYTIKTLWRLTVKAFGTGQIITTGYTDRNMAEIHDYIESFTGLPAKSLILSTEKGILRTDESEIMQVYVVAYFKENEKLENICLKYGINHLKSLKLRFLTKEEELNPREIESIQDIKNYVHKTHNILYRQQSILFQHQEIENDSTKIFDLFSQNTSFEREMHFHVVIVKQTFTIEVDTDFRRNHSRKYLIEISGSDTIAEVKMKILEKHYPERLEYIQKQLSDPSSILSSTSRKVPTDCFVLRRFNNVFEDSKTVEECKILPNLNDYDDYVFEETILVRIRLDSLQKGKDIIEYPVTKFLFDFHCNETLKEFRLQNGIDRKELHVMPHQIGVTRHPEWPWKIQNLEGEIVCVLDYFVVKRNSSCYIM